MTPRGMAKRGHCGRRRRAAVSGAQLLLAAAAVVLCCLIVCLRQLKAYVAAGMEDAHMTVRADRLLAERRPVAAAALYRQLVRRYPSLPGTHSDLARALFMAGRTQEAADEARVAIGLSKAQGGPDSSASARLVLGDVLLTDGHRDAAAKQWEMALIAARKAGNRAAREEAEYRLTAVGRSPRDVPSR